MMKEPMLNREDLAELVTLLDEGFERVTFNGFGEAVALLDMPAGMFGTVTASYYVRESHLKVYRKGDQPCEADLFNGHLYDRPKNRADLESKVRSLLVEAAQSMLLDFVTES